jgi:hypothetical protein
MQLLQRLIREPLVHFLVIGVLVFAIYRGGETPANAPGTAVIIVTQPQVARLAGQFEAAWRRAPTEPEITALVEDSVREEVYYREALTLGLDRDDPVIRRRLRQKMEFLSEGAAASTAPDEAALAAHHAAHPERFADPPRITFRQVLLTGVEEAEAARAVLASGADPSMVGRTGLLPEVMEASDEVAVDAAFGPGFFVRVAALPQGGWEGPVPSAYGAHLVEVLAFEPARLRPFEAVRAAVEQDWHRANAEAVRDAQYEALRQRYRVVLPEPGE